MSQNTYLLFHLQETPVLFRQLLVTNRKLMLMVFNMLKDEKGFFHLNDDNILICQSVEFIHKFVVLL